MITTALPGMLASPEEIELERLRMRAKQLSAELEIARLDAALADRLREWEPPPEYEAN